MTELTVDELRNFSLELGRRDPRFMRIVSADVAKGQGTYEVHLATGKTGVVTFTFEGSRIVTPAFSEAQIAMLAAAVATRAPNPYAEQLIALGVAERLHVNPTFEARRRVEHIQHIMAGAERRAADLGLSRMSEAEDLSKYAAPHPYAAGLKALRAAESTPESRFEDEYRARRRRELGLPSEA